MKRFLSALCAATLGFAVAITSAIPVNAAPPLPERIETSSNVVTVQHREWRHGPRHWQGRRDWGDRRWRGRPGWNRPGWRHGPRPGWRHGWRGHRPGYWRGYHGYRYYRHGYRRYSDGWWYPLAAFGAGVAVGGALSSPPARAVPRYANSHVAWCANRYRSYRAYDNTYQPYNGPRRQCYSPYS
jgi:hypothetical protein